MSAPVDVFAGQRWTNPFYGVQHLNGLRRGFQITVADLGSVAECKVFLPGHGFNAKVSVHEDAASARAHGERQAHELDALFSCAYELTTHALRGLPYPRSGQPDRRRGG